MADYESTLGAIARACPDKLVISKPVNAQYIKIDIRRTHAGYQAARYTDKQVFHLNFNTEQLGKYLLDTVPAAYCRVNAWDSGGEHMLLVSKKGELTYKYKRSGAPAPAVQAGTGHDRVKSYIIPEGAPVGPLKDMGIFTQEGKVVKSMTDKFRQINRFLEIIDDELKQYKGQSISVIDFGCGKSYLTFVLYYYLTQIKGLDARVTGLDLKADVIERCNIAARQYGYTGLSFKQGDIAACDEHMSVDMVVTLHACDTATDYALFEAVKRNAKMIFSVPCCQHELNAAVKSQRLGLLTRYGIVKERFAALATDALRANLLDCCGYKTQLLEFIDLEHTPKNILIRAHAAGNIPASVKNKRLEQVRAFMEEFEAVPTFYTLLEQAGII